MPRSHTRLGSGVTRPRESSGVKASAAGASLQVGPVQEASNHAGRSIKRTLQRRDNDRPEAGDGTWRSRSAFSLEKASGAGEGLDTSNQLSSRRRGDGTHGRNDDPKQGTSGWQPIRLRMAKTCPITGITGKWVGVAQRGGSGRSSVDAGDNITSAERRTRGLRCQGFGEGLCELP